MPIKKDESGKRWVEMQLLMPGTPEQLWQALATGRGYRGWFTKTEIDGRVGGKVQFAFGDGTTSVGEVTDWEPPHRVAYVERDWEKDAPPIATEITIPARSGDRCVVRMVHSLFTTTDDWDDQVEGFESGWTSLFEVLRVYLAHFIDQEAAAFWVMTPTKTGSLATWQKLCEALGIAGANVGERRQAAFGAESWACVVEHVHQDARQRYCLLRLEKPRPGIALVGTYDVQGDRGEADPTVRPLAESGETTRVSVSRYFYGDDAEAQAAQAEPAWRDWLRTTFGS
jgi:uncharacterized protein YndB with AHSA1/START domain